MQDRRAKLEQAGFSLVASVPHALYGQRAKLEPAGFRLVASGPQALNDAGLHAERWNACYQQLKEFYLEAGHCDVNHSQVCSHLLRWVRWQRIMHRASKLTEEKQRLLKEIGVTFGGRPQAADSAMQWEKTMQWEKMMEQLLDVIEENGRLPVVRDHP